MYLRKTKTDPNKFLSLNREWVGNLQGETFTISREDGWQVKYTQGHIRQLRTDGGRVLLWNYENGKAVGVSEEGSAQTPIKVADMDGSSPSFSVNGKIHSIHTAQRPRVECVGATNLVTAMDQALSEWKWPDGKSTTYTFAVNERIEPTLEVLSREGRTESYSWDPKTGNITFGEGWVYTIANPTGPFEPPRITRTNEQGESEFLAINNKKGVIERSTLSDGHTLTERFSTPGPLHGKVRKVERIAGDQRELLLQASYDEAGRLIRQVDEHGFSTVHTFSDKGLSDSTIVVPPSDEQKLRPLLLRESQLKNAVDSARTKPELGDAVQALALFYITDFRDPRKAVSLLPRIKDARQKFNVMLHAVEGDATLSATEKAKQLTSLLNDFPGEASLLQSLISNHQAQSANP